MALDSAHQQLFTAWPALDRVDVLSTSDYHMIHSIAVPSPSTLDISPDGTTLAVGTSASHIFFFNTATFAKTNDIVFPGAALGITAFLYTANGNAMIRAAEGLSTGGGITAYWNSTSNAFQNVSNAENPTKSIYSPTGPLARSGDYSRIILGDASSGGALQVIDGNSGQILWALGGPYGTDSGGSGYGGYIDALAVNKDGSRYAVCVEVPGFGPYLLVLNSSFDEVYQDEDGCIGMTFSGDGQSLYRNVSVDSTSDVQVLDMTAFTARNVPTYSTSYMFWEASDTSGMVYGVGPQIGAPQGGSEVLWIALDTTSSTAPPIPPANDSLQVIRIIDNIGSPQGGDSIRMICTGVGSSATVTIGGAQAKNVSITTIGDSTPPSAGLPNELMVTLTTPAGTPGPADVVLSSNGSMTTVSKGFQYANSSTVFPFATSPNFLVFDSLRNRLYAAHQNQVEVIDVASKAVFTPLVPVAGKLTNSKFAGISLSPDQNRLYIADGGAGMIHMLDLTNPGKGYSINVGTAIGQSPTLAPGRVFELSTGKLFGDVIGSDLDQTGTLFQIDPNSATGDWARNALGNPISEYVWNTTNNGEYALISKDGSFPGYSFVGLWDANSSTNVSPSGETQWVVEASANEDGTVIAAGGSTPGLQDTYPEIIDFNLNAIGYIYQHFDVSMPTGTPSFFLHPSGALLYKAGIFQNSGPVEGGRVEIDDLHQWQTSAVIAFPEPFQTSDNPLTDHMLTIDPMGTYLFGVTQSGITMMALNAVPLSIGNVQPAFVQLQGGQSITLRGSGFQPGATVSIGSTQAITTYVDGNTLSVQVPALSPGWTDVTVTLAGGAAYTAPSLLQVLGAQPAPAVAGFSPSSIVVQSNIPGFDTTASVTVLGSGFEVYDTVEINGQPVSSDFIDAGHLQATIPADLTGETGSISVAVVSPYNGSSNSLALPMVNPVPVLEDDLPLTVVPGNGLGLNLNGTGFVAGSMIQWNGQNLSTYLNGGETPSGLGVVSASVPGSLTTQAGTATVTVFNPGPGGGVSNAQGVDVSSAHPVLFIMLFNSSGTAAIPYYSFPTSIDLGTIDLNTSTTQGLSLQNIGTASYVFSSTSVTPGPFSVRGGSCPSIPPPPTELVCVQPLTFAPTSAGAAVGTLTITDNTPGSPHIITLTGTGIQTPVPTVTLSTINAVGETLSTYLQGSTVVGGPSIPATAWVEYGTDPTLSTFTQSTPWTLTGDGTLSANLSGLAAGTQYAVRFAVQSAAGTGKSSIHLFATEAAYPNVTLALATGASNIATVTAGQTATYSMVASDGGNGYIGTATLTCSGAPTGATCTISPSQFTVNTTATPIT
jgi:hypothetical protein